MIPTIETIVEDLAAGKITKQQAIAWLHRHAEDAGRCLRDDFAAAALQGLIASEQMLTVATQSHKPLGDELAQGAYEMADAMLKAREQ